RACRQHQAIAYAAAIFHQDLDIPGKRQVLQAIIRKDHIHSGKLLDQGLCSQSTLRVDADRYARLACNQTGLVAELRGVESAATCAWQLADVHTVAAADHARMPAARLQSCDGGQKKG